MSDIVEQLRNARPWVGKIGADAADQIESLRGELAEWKQAASVEASLRREFRASLDKAVEALKKIKQATLEGRVCDDVAWFDSITTLHDFCEITLEAVASPERCNKE